MTAAAPRIPLVFPPNPAVDDEYTTPTGVTYRWDGVVWVSVGTGGGGGGRITIDDNAPTSPDVGALWFNSLDLQTYLWYDDSNSIQWVPINNQQGGDGYYLPLAGGILSGALQTYGGFGGSNLGLRIGAANTGFWNSGSSLFLNYGGASVAQFSGGNSQFNSPLTLQNDPTIDLGAATKRYVDNKFGLTGTIPGWFQIGPLIIQWGIGTSPNVPAGGAVGTVVTYPKAFSGPVYVSALTAFWFYTTGPEMTTLYNGGASETSISVVIQNYQTFDVTVNFDWIVLGPA